MAMRALDKREEDRLAELEETIRHGLSTFIAVGMALAEIREGKLYRKTHATFEAYCEDQWAFTASRARQLIEAANVANEMTATTCNTPKNESQSRVLAGCEKEARAPVWEVAEETGQSVQVVVEALDALSPEAYQRVKEGNRKPLKDAVKEQEEAATDHVTPALRALDAARKKIEQLNESGAPALRHLDRARAVVAALADLG